MSPTPAEPGGAPVMLVLAAEGDMMIVHVPPALERAALVRHLRALGDEVLAWITTMELVGKGKVITFETYVAELLDPDVLPDLHKQTCDMLGYQHDDLPAFFDNSINDERPTCTCGVVDAITALRPYLPNDHAKR